MTRWESPVSNLACWTIRDRALATVVHKAKEFGMHLREKWNDIVKLNQRILLLQNFEVHRQMKYELNYLKEFPHRFRFL
jgi:hypothetical protein